MEIIESISWVASGFVPTLLLLEVSLRIGRKKSTRRKYTAVNKIAENIRSAHKAEGMENPQASGHFYDSVFCPASLTTPKINEIRIIQFIFKI
jgi:hypothetical protein